MTTENSYEILTDEELADAIENDMTDNNFKTAAEFLYNACNDWPTLNLSQPRDLIAELTKEINRKLTYDNLSTYNNSLNVTGDAWKGEAVSSLLEMFDFERKSVFDKRIELQAIIDKITKHYRKPSA
jgi:hypothetical protein